MLHELNEIILDIYRVAQDATTDEFQARALELVSSILPFDSCRWGMALKYEGHQLAIQNAYEHREMPGVLDAYIEVLSQDLVGLAAAAHAGTTINVNARQLCEAQPDRAAYLDYLCRFRHENMLVTGMVAPSGSARSLSYYRRDKDDRFTERERQLCQALFPHMMEALTINLRIGLAQFQNTGSATRWPLAMCDCNGVILYAEPDFFTLLSAQWPAMKMSRLPATLINALLVQGQPAYASDQVFVCIGLRQDKVLYLKARARHPSDSLSPRELQVARLVAKGMKFKEIAMTLQLAPATVRNHIQRIHERLGVRSNAELAAQLTIALP
jgi:DNA-binding CsgD family transcriptional regulator